MNKLYYYKNNPIVTKIFLAMLAPTIFMNLTTAIASMADTMIIGHYLDDLSLSVVTFATPIFMVINTVSALFSVGGCIATSIDLGKGEKESANKTFSLSMEFLALVSILLFFSGLFFSEIITGWLGAGKEVFENVRIYSQIILMGSPALVLNIGIAFFVRNDGRPTLSMVGMFVSIISDIILNFVFVGYMNMGVSGAAYSTVIGQLLSVLVISSHFFSSKNTLKFYLTLKGGVLRIIKNGISTALHFIYQFLTVLILNHYVVSLAGTDGVVVYTVVFNLYTVSLSLFEGISQTIQPMVGVYFGEGCNRKIKQTLKLAFITIIILCGGVTLFLEAVPAVIPKIFGISDAFIKEQSAVAVRIYSVSMIIMTVNVVIGYYLQSIEKNKMSAYLVSLRCCVLFLASVFVLGKIFGMNGIWASYTTAEVITFFVYIVMTRAEQRKLAKNGTVADAFLLDKEREKNTKSFVFDCLTDDFEDFEKETDKYLQSNEKFGCDIICFVKDYISQLKNITEPDKKGKYVEAEFNGTDKTIIIRDNLNHALIRENICNALNNENNKEYGPVLGWNRIYLK